MGLQSGVYRFGKSKTYHKKAVYKFLKKTAPKKAAADKPTFIEKPVKGDKNGGKRMVRVKRLRNDVPTIEKAAKGTSKNFFSKHKRSLRSTLQPGTIAICLAGPHKGKRVIVLNQLASGLVLITGPMKLNGCPMRRINQQYLLATQTSIDVTGVKALKPSMMIILRGPRHLKVRRKVAISSHQKKRNTNLLNKRKLIKPIWTNKC